MDTQPIVNEIFDSYKSGEVTPKTHSTLILKAMEYVEVRKELTGKQKKQLVVEIFEQVAEKGEELNLDIDIELVKETIELIVDISKKRVNINQVVSLSMRILLYFSQSNFNCFKSCRGGKQ